MSNWTREELSATVSAYIGMLNLEQQGQKFIKSRYYEELSKQFDRSPQAFSYRMRNISHVFSQLGKQHLKGLEPLSNIGKNYEVIKELILEIEKISVLSKHEFEEAVSKLRQQANLTEPTGNLVPQKQITEIYTYNRDPSVVAWILQNSKGVCASCEQPAPFVKSDGNFYLEVHHLRRLADGGSDTIANVIAVCPNCHQELHYGESKNTKSESIYAKLKRLKKE